MKSMTLKDLHVAVKNGATESELIARYGLKSVEALYEIMAKVTPGKFEFFKKELKKNQKNRLRKANKETEVDMNPENAELEAEKVETETYQQESFLETENKNEESVDDVHIANTEIAIEEPESAEKQPTLEELLESEEFLSKNCYALEQEHNELMIARKEDVEELAKIKKNLEELKRLLQANQAKMANVLEDYNSKAEQMLKVSSEIKACKEMLKETREQIEEARKLKISVYSDGTIECENGELKTPCETEVSQLMSTIILQTAAEELTVKQIKTVAKLVLMVKQLDKNFELEFDSDSVQKLYETVIA